MSGTDLPFYVKDLSHALARRESWSLGPCAHVVMTKCCEMDVEIGIAAHNSVVGCIVDDGSMFSHICTIYVSTANDVGSAGAAMNSLLKSFPLFVDQHCRSNAAVSDMGVIELATLALLLSSADALPSDSFFQKLSDTLLEQQTRECLVSGLLVILNNQSKGQVFQQAQSQQHAVASSTSAPIVDISALRISLAVASLAYVLDGHTMADSLLTAANISQLLRLSMSKAVYPSPVRPSAIFSRSGSNNNYSNISTNESIGNHGMSQLWEIAFCRTALRRLLQIPVVLSSDSAVDEAFTFVSKWWDRLQKASSELSTGATSAAAAGAVRTPSKLSRYNVPLTAPADGASKLPVVPTVRTALEVVLDLHEALPQIRDYVRQTAFEGGAGPARGLSFFAAYVRSVDPRTSHIAARLAARIVRDANSTSTSTAIAAFARDTAALLACACSHLHNILATINTATDAVGNDAESLAHPLRDVTNTSSSGAAAGTLRKRSSAAVVGSSSSSIAAASVRAVLLPVVYSLIDLVAACSEGSPDAQQTQATINAVAAALRELCNTSTHALPALSSKQRVTGVGSAAAAASAAVCVRCLALACSRIDSCSPAELAAAGSDAKATIRLMLADGGPKVLHRLLTKAGLGPDGDGDDGVCSFLRDCRSDSSKVLNDSQATRCTMPISMSSKEPGANTNATPSPIVRLSVRSPGCQQTGRYADDGNGEGDESEGDPSTTLNLTHLTHVVRPPPAATVALSSDGRGPSNGDPRAPSPPTNSQQLSSLFTPAHSKSRARHERTLAAVPDTDDTDDQGGGSDGMDLSDECGQRASFLSPDIRGEHCDHQQGHLSDMRPATGVPARQPDQLTQRLPSSDEAHAAQSPSVASTTAGPISTSPLAASRIDEHDDAEMSVATNGSDADVDIGGMDVEGAAPTACPAPVAIHSARSTHSLSPALVSPSVSAVDADVATDRAALLARVAMLESQAAGTISQLAALRGERDCALKGSEQLRFRLEAAAVDSAGLRAAVDAVHEEAQRQAEQIQSLQMAKARAECTAQESDNRRSEAEALLQEAWTKLSALAKLEAAQGSENRRLSQLAEATAAELRVCQDELRQAVSAEKQASGRAAHLAASTEPLQKKYAALSSVAQEVRDQLSDSKAQVACLSAQVTSLQGSLEVEARGHEQCRRSAETQASEVHVWRTRHEEEERAHRLSESVCRDQQQQLEVRTADVAKLQTAVRRLETAVEEETCAHQRSREQCQGHLAEIQELQSVHEELEQAVAHWHSEFDREHDALEEQQRVADTLRTELKAARGRADAAQNELSKHRELILFINKLSAGAEGETGKETARRLSLALSQDHGQNPGPVQAIQVAEDDRDEECVEMAVDVASRPPPRSKGNDAKIDCSVAKRASRRGGKDDGEGSSR